jgi:uncharacterized protein YyaL (SSP411 family)
MLQNVVRALVRYPLGLSNWLKVLDCFLSEGPEIVVIGSPKQREPLLEPIRRHFVPGKVLVLAEAGEPNPAERVPLLEGRHCPPDQAKAYVCRHFTCHEPTADPNRLRELLVSWQGQVADS